MAETCNGKVMILMRGLPSCGKSYTSRRLAREREGGVVIEFDEYFYTQVGEDPSTYNWSDDLLPQAREWNVSRIKRAVDEAVSPIIVDNDNGLDPTTGDYVRYGLDHGYEIRLKEPESRWWQEIRRLLEDKESNRQALESWARKLAELSKRMHRVPLSSVFRRIDCWKNDVTVEDFIGVS